MQRQKDRDREMQYVVWQAPLGLNFTRLLLRAGESCEHLPRLVRGTGQRTGDPWFLPQETQKRELRGGFSVRAPG